ncbi:MAG: hypothetical protein ACI82Q_002479 [Nonlabens sp.]
MKEFHFQPKHTHHMLDAVHPKLPMRSKSITMAYYQSLGFAVYGSADFEGYLMMQRDKVQIHFFEFKELDPLKNYGQIYLRTDSIDSLYQLFIDQKLEIHPAGALTMKPWGIKEFVMLDPDHNLLTFGEGL